MSATSVGQTTDLVYLLQAGKTVDISRVASESTDLLSAFSTASATLWPAAAPPTRPAAGRLAAAAAHRAAGEDCDVLAGGSIAEDGYCVLFQVRRCNSIGVLVLLLLNVLYYMEIRHIASILLLGILKLLMSPA